MKKEFEEYGDETDDYDIVKQKKIKINLTAA
jgi:hypothetical protein